MLLKTDLCVMFGRFIVYRFFPCGIADRLLLLPVNIPLLMKALQRLGIFFLFLFFFFFISSSPSSFFLLVARS